METITADARATTWRTLLSLPGRVGIVEPVEHEALLRLARVDVRLVGPGPA